MSRELDINTVIVPGDFRSFKAAFSRSVLGVTFRKFKRKRAEFYKHRIHNEAVTQQVQRRLYEHLLTETNLKNISDFKLQTSMTLEWDTNGKIKALKDIDVVVYMKVGELRVDKIDFRKKTETVSIDLFYSEIDSASQALRSSIPKLIELMGEENFDFKEHDFLEDEGRKKAKAYDVKRVPTVVINAENVIENPDEKRLRQEVEKAFSPKLSVTKPEFLRAPTRKPVVKLLAESIVG